jgi:hypothetical protein
MAATHSQRTVDSEPERKLAISRLATAAARSLCVPEPKRWHLLLLADPGFHICFRTTASRCQRSASRWVLASNRNADSARAPDIINA